MIPQLVKERITATANQLVGVPYRTKGRSVRGVDCAGLIFLILRGFCELNDFQEYPEELTSNFVFRNVKQFARRIEREAADVGDVGLCCFKGATTHLGLLIGDRCIVHADRTIGRVVKQTLRKDSRLGPSGRVSVFYRVKALEREWLK